MSKFRRLPLLLRTHAQPTMQVSRKERSREIRMRPLAPGVKFFNSRKVSFLRKGKSGSTHPRSISDWLAGIGEAASMGEVDHSGFVFDERQMESERFLILKSPRES